MAVIGTDVAVARAFLAQGNVVGLPTETVYGLAANALNPDAVLRIFTVKNRPAFDPLIVHTDALVNVARFVTDLPAPARRLADAFWPGPLTLLLPKRDVVPDLTTSGLPTVAVRVPNHPLALELLRSIDFPLAAPSANPFGYISPTTAGHVAAQLGDQIPYILDGGPCSVGVESTIVGFDAGQPIVFRLGGLALEALEDVAGQRLTVRAHSTSNPTAPGMLSSHYAPRKPLTLLSLEQRAEGQATLGGGQEGNAGALVFRERLPGIPAEFQRVLSPSGNVAEAAKHLFAYLRELDALPVSHLYAELLPDEGLGRAINDRLRRAAHREER